MIEMPLAEHSPPAPTAPRSPTWKTLTLILALRARHPELFVP
ncbi:hypothetical protein ACU4GR_17650 [Methylobacterium oryzae CBMB20]